MTLGILWDVLGVYESHVLDEIFVRFISIYFWRKMTSLPRLINTTLAWGGSNCFGHHYFMYFQTKQTKTGSSLRPVLWPSLGVKQLGRSCSDKVTDLHLFSCHSPGSTPRFFPGLIFILGKYGIWRRWGGRNISVVKGIRFKRYVSINPFFPLSLTWKGRRVVKLIGEMYWLKITFANIKAHRQY